MRSDKDILIISIFTFLTVITWIFVDFVKTIETPVQTNVSEELLAPLPETIDTGILDELESRREL